MNLTLDLGFKFGGGWHFSVVEDGTFRLAPGRHFPMSGP